MVYSSLRGSVCHQLVHKREDVRILWIVEPPVGCACRVLWGYPGFACGESAVEVASVLLGEDALASVELYHCGLRGKVRIAKPSPRIPICAWLRPFLQFARPWARAKSVRELCSNS